MEHSKLSLRTWFYAMHLMTSHQAGAFRKRSPAPAADRTIPSRVAYDDEVEEHHGKAGFHIPNCRMKWSSMRRSFRYGFLKRRAVRKSSAGQEANSKPRYLSSLKANLLTLYCQQYLCEATEQSIRKASKLTKKAERQSIGKVVHYIKMFVIDNLSADTLDKIVRKHIDKDTVIVSDGSSSHINFEGYFKGYERHVESNVDSVVKTHLPWVHVVIGRCRSGIAAIHGEVEQAVFCNFT